LHAVLSDEVASVRQTERINGASLCKRLFTNSYLRCCVPSKANRRGMAPSFLCLNILEYRLASERNIKPVDEKTQRYKEADDGASGVPLRELQGRRSNHAYSNRIVSCASNEADPSKDYQEQQ